MASAVGELMTQVALKAPEVTASGGIGLGTDGPEPEGDVLAVSLGTTVEPPPPPHEAKVAHRAKKVNFRRQFKI